jgi:thioredoxin 1
MANNVLEVTDDNFKEEVLESKEPVLVDFWASWCGPCQAMGPILEETASELNGVKVVKVNVDENPQSSSNYGVMSIPTLLVFKDGEVVDQMVGLQSKDSLISKLSQI